MLLPRGNRKTSLGAALALLHTDGPEAVPGGEVLFAATDQKQARIGFREAEAIITASTEMWRKGQANRRFDASGTAYQALKSTKTASSSPTAHSLRRLRPTAQASMAARPSSPSPTKSTLGRSATCGT